MRTRCFDFDFKDSLLSFRIVFTTNNLTLSQKIIKHFHDIHVFDFSVKGKASLENQNLEACLQSGCNFLLTGCCLGLLVPDSAQAIEKFLIEIETHIKNLEEISEGKDQTARSVANEMNKFSVQSKMLVAQALLGAVAKMS